MDKASSCGLVMNDDLLETIIRNNIDSAFLALGSVSTFCLASSILLVAALIHNSCDNTAAVLGLV